MASATLQSAVTTLQNLVRGRATLLMGCAVLLPLYWIGAQVGLYLAQSYGIFTPLWLPAGIITALFLIDGWRWWPVVVLGEALLAFTQGWSPILLAIFIGIRAFEGVAIVLLLQRHRVALPANSPNDILNFTLIAVLSVPLLSAALVAAAPLLLENASWAGFLLRWLGLWMGDAMGILLVVPALVYGLQAPLRGVALRRAILFTLLLVLAGMLLLLLSRQGQSSDLLFLLLPIVVCAALYSNGTGVGLAVLALSSLVLVSGLNQHPYWSSIEAIDIVIYQAFVGCAAFTGYLISAALAAERRARRQMAFQASHDALTNLYNRRAFEASLHEHLKAPDPIGGSDNGVKSCALLFLDLDQFKLVNDNGGHKAGDLLLMELSQRLQARIPHNGLLARLGGDEFGVLLKETDLEQATAIAEALRLVVINFGLPYDGHTYRVGVSIGVTLFKPGKDEPNSVLHRADVACYAAKEAGRNRIHCYREDNSQTMRIHSERRWLARLHWALEGGQFRLARQRICSLSDQAGNGLEFYEVLLRLDEDNLTVPATDFIAAAERYRFVGTLDRWVIEQVFKRLSQVPADNRCCYSINLSGVSLDDPEFCSFVVGLQQRYGVRADRLCFEITESTVIRHLKRAVRTMRELGAKGFRFALDDFGSGVASFGYLEQLPVDFVKLDGRFVQELDRNPTNAIIIRALTQIAQLRGLCCIAESVESLEVVETLQQLGITMAQGYYLHRPEPLLAA